MSIVCSNFQNSVYSLRECTPQFFSFKVGIVFVALQSLIRLAVAFLTLTCPDT
jgi:hypothetical protein